jgi:hypothetical protein
MIGDYQGHASAGNDFLNLFGYPPRHHGTDVVNGDAIYFRRVVNRGGAAGAAGGLDVGAQDVAGADLGSSEPSLGAALRLDPAGASSTVVLALDQAAGQSSPVDAPTLTDLQPDTAAAATGLTHDGQRLAHAAPSHAADVVMPALLSGGDIQDIQ